MGNERKYIGDSVYYKFDGFGIELTTDNGLGPSNTIYIEPQTLAALLGSISENYDKAAMHKILCGASSETG